MATGGTDWSSAPTINVYDQGPDYTWTVTDPLGPAAGSDWPYFSRWYKIEIGNGDDWWGILTVDTLSSNPDGDTVIQVFDEGLDLAARNDDQWNADWYLSECSFTTEPGRTYFVQVGTYGDDGSGMSEFVTKFKWERKAEVHSLYSGVLTPDWNGLHYVKTIGLTLDGPFDPVAAGDRAFIITAGTPNLTAWPSGWESIDYRAGQRTQGATLTRQMTAGPPDSGGNDSTSPRILLQFDAPDPVQITVVILRGWYGWTFLNADRVGTEGVTQPAGTLTIPSASDSGDTVIFAGAIRDAGSAVTSNRGLLDSAVTNSTVTGYVWVDEPTSPQTEARLSLPAHTGHYFAAIAVWGWNWHEYVANPIGEYSKAPATVVKDQKYFKDYHDGGTDLAVDGSELARMALLTDFATTSGSGYLFPGDYETDLFVDIGPVFRRNTYGHREFRVQGASLLPSETSAWYPPVLDPPTGASPDYAAYEGQDPSTGSRPKATVTGVLGDMFDTSAEESNLDDSSSLNTSGATAASGTWSTILVPTTGIYTSGALSDWTPGTAVGASVLYRRGKTGGKAVKVEIVESGIDLTPAIEDPATGKCTILGAVVNTGGTSPYSSTPSITTLNNMSSAGGGAHIGAKLGMKRFRYQMLPPRSRFAYRYPIPATPVVEVVPQLHISGELDNSRVRFLS